MPKLTSIRVEQIKPELRELAYRTGAIDEDGFVIIENRYCAFPMQADKIYSPDGKPIQQEIKV